MLETFKNIIYKSTQNAQTCELSSLPDYQFGKLLHNKKKKVCKWHCAVNKIFKIYMNETLYIFVKMKSKYEFP